MTAWRLCCALLLSLVLMLVHPSQSSAASKPIRSLKQSLHQLGDVTVPAAWAGIWTVSDTMKLCGVPGPIIPVQTHSDTMCAGDVITGDETVTYTCSGTATATTVDMTCTGSSDDGNGCVGDYTETLHGTRNGDDALLTYTINVVYTPSGCQDDGCIELVIAMHRTAGPPAECSITPTLKTTWGKLKKRYR
jgi:hypothetical protein